MIDFPVPLIGFAAYSGTGKTTLLLRLIPLLKAQGLRLAVIKHAHHGFDMDEPGKDSYELRKAGAAQMVVGSRKRMVLFLEHEGERAEPDLSEALSVVDPDRADLVLVEGFKHEDFPKIELHRKALGRPPMFPEDPNIVAIACDQPEVPLGVDTDLPRLSIDDPAGVADFIRGRILGLPV